MSLICRAYSDLDGWKTCQQELNTGKTVQSVRDYSGRDAQRLARPLRNSIFGEFELLQSSQERATVIGGLHSGNEGDLVFRAASGFATSEHAPGEGTVALYTYVACGANFHESRATHP